MEFYLSFLGRDAEASRIPNDSRVVEAQPTINKLYQMLHISSELPNRTELGANFNYSTLNPIHSFNFYDDLKVSNPDNANLCCEEDRTAINTSDVRIGDVDERSKKVRQRRVVRVRSDDVRETSVAPQMMERRRRPGETGSSAPLLNYIFDTYTNTHQHRNGK